jgi:hypothetical protein
MFESIGIFSEFGAGNEIRTRDLNLGKVALYQLSYSRALLKTQHFMLISLQWSNYNAI